jgi:hypothetical protein
MKMLNYNTFKGKLNDKTIFDFLKYLNKQVVKIEDRLKILNNILYPNGELDDFFVEYFNQPQEDSGRGYFKVNLNKDEMLSEKDGVCSKIEIMGNYLLYGEEAKELKILLCTE